MWIYLGNQSRVIRDTYSRTDICMYKKKQFNFPMTWSNISIGKCMKRWDQEFPTKWCIWKNWRYSTIVCRLNFTIKVFVWHEYKVCQSFSIWVLYKADFPSPWKVPSCAARWQEIDARNQRGHTMLRAKQWQICSSAFLIRSLRKWRQSIPRVFSIKLAPKMI